MRRPRLVRLPMVLLGIVWVAGLGLVIFGLWNALMPVVLGLHAITYWQAVGLLVLSRLLLGTWGGRMGRPHFARGPFASGWARLTPEERQRFRQAMGQSETGRHCGPWRDTPDATKL